MARQAFARKWGDRYDWRLANSAISSNEGPGDHLVSRNDQLSGLWGMVSVPDLRYHFLGEASGDLLRIRWQQVQDEMRATGIHE